MRPPARSFEKGCTSRMRFEGSNASVRDVPVALRAGTLAVALPLFRARAVPVATTLGIALVVVVALVDLAAAAGELAPDGRATLTAVVESASLLPALLLDGAAAGGTEVAAGAAGALAAATVGMGGSSEPSRALAAAGLAGAVGTAPLAACAVGTLAGTWAAAEAPEAVAPWATGAEDGLAPGAAGEV